jgi:hypothetical protein
VSPAAGAPRRGTAWARAAILGYLALLLLAAVPEKLRPVLLDAPGRFAARALEAVSISPGLAVFSGPVTAVHRRATCLEFRAERPDGSTETLYASECPPSGFRWRIDPWDEMVQGLVRRTRIERFAREPGGDAPPRTYEWWKLQALGDFFCHSPEAASGERRAVTLETYDLLVLYSSGIHTRDRTLSCRWRCGTRPLAAPSCERIAPEIPPVPRPARARGERA